MQESTVTVVIFKFQSNRKLAENRSIAISLSKKMKRGRKMKAFFHSSCVDLF